MPRVHLALVVCLLSALIGRTPAAHIAAGTLRGTVSISAADSSSPARARPMIADLGGMPPDPVDRRRSVVYVEGAAPQPSELPTMRVRMDQRNEQFVPRVLAITAGSVVEFPNNDTKFHNVFSLSKPNAFDLGRYAPGRTGARRFDHPGLIRVFCDIHSHMSGYILVFDHRYFAITDDNGRYEIANLPAGTYTLAVWSEVARAEPKRVTVPDSGVTEADFLISRAP